MQITRTAVVSRPCVPVSTPDTPVSKDETAPVIITPHSLNEGIYSVAEAIGVLIENHYTVGCDGELLPPLSVIKEMKGVN